MVDFEWFLCLILFIVGGKGSHIFELAATAEKRFQNRNTTKKHTFVAYRIK